MDIRQYYEEVEALVGDLRGLNRSDVADRVDDALRSGSTSGEVLGELSLTLPTVADTVPAVAERSGSLAEWARQALA